MKNTLMIFSGCFGGFLTIMWGEWSGLFTTVAIFMLLDCITGLITSVKNKSTKTENGKISSKSFLLGILKKIVMLILVCVGYRLDITLEVSFIRDGVLYALMVNEGLSILENAGNIGIKTDFLKKYFEQVGDKNV